jgi:putative Holliday junction resolvase
MRSLGLDIGDKRIGVALSDPQGILASPLTIINCIDERADLKLVLEIINQYQAKQVIIGLPLLMDGSTGHQAEKVKKFANKLGQHTDVPFEFRDERLTTAAARKLMRAKNVGKCRRAKKKATDDAIAAALILQSYLDEEHQVSS